MAAKKKTAKKAAVKKGAAVKKQAKAKKAVKKAPAKKKSVAKPKLAVKKPAAKRLHRSEKSRMLAGVCGGIGEYFGIDPNIVRLVWIAVSLLGGVWSIITSMVIYAIAAGIIPKK